MKQKRISLKLCCLFLYILTFLGCGPSQTVRDEAITSTKWVAKNNSGSSYNCKDFKIKSAEKLELSKADKANGLSEKWDVEVSFICHRYGKWRDCTTLVQIVKKNGKVIRDSFLDVPF